MSAACEIGFSLAHGSDLLVDSLAKNINVFVSFPFYPPVITLPGISSSRWSRFNIDDFSR
jgi:hypothetical protein